MTEPIPPVEEDPQYSAPEVPLRNGRPWGIRQDLYEGLKTHMISEGGAWDLVDQHMADAQGYVDEAWEWTNKAREHSETSFEHSQASYLHSQASLDYSALAAQHSADSLMFSDESAQHNTSAQVAAGEAAQHSADSLAYSESAHGHSQEAWDWSESARQFSADSLTHSQSSVNASESSSVASQAAIAAAGEADGFSQASWNYMVSAEGYRDAAEVARSAAEVARAAAESNRSDAEDARQEAEAARDDAEQKRAAAEGARARAMAAMAASAGSMQMAEGARSQAESSRAQAEASRASAEGERELAEREREEAEHARSEADQARTEAVTSAVSAVEAATQAVEESLKSANQEKTYQIAASSSDDYITVTTSSGNLSITAKPGWIGKITISTQRRTGTTNASYVYFMEWHDYQITSTVRTINLSGSSATGNYISALVHYTITPGIPRSVPRKLENIPTPANETWTTIDTHTVGAKARPNHHIYFRIGWDRATFQYSYGVRIMLRRVNTTTELRRVGPHNGVGPLTFLGNGYRHQWIERFQYDLQPGDRLEFQARANGVQAREIRDSQINVNWVDEP